MVDTSDEWIVTRTGIRERRIAADDETTTTLSVHAARDALAVAGLDPSRGRPRDRRHLLAGLPAAGHLGDWWPPLWRHPCGRLRPPGGLLGLPLRARHRERLHPQRHVPQRAGHRGRGAEPLHRLERPQHLRPVRRRGGGGAALRVRRSRAGSSASTCSAMAPAARGSSCRPAASAARPRRDQRRGETALHPDGRARRLQVRHPPAGRLGVGRAAPGGPDGRRRRPVRASTRPTCASSSTSSASSGSPTEKVFINIEKYGNTSAASVPMALVEASRPVASSPATRS